MATVVMILTDTEDGVQIDMRCPEAERSVVEITPAMALATQISMFASTLTEGGDEMSGLQ